MAITNSVPKPQLSYAISYGLVSGPGHGRQFRKLLDAAGYVQSQAMASADILIAHSAGCWMLPAGLAPKLVFLVGPALNEPSATNWAHANLENIKAFTGNHHVLKGTKLISFNIFYALLQPKRSRAIIRQAKHADLQSFSNSQVIFIANRKDPWPHPAGLESYIQDKPWAFMSLPGSHENIWEMPDRYVAIINHHAKQLLAQANS